LSGCEIFAVMFKCGSIKPFALSVAAAGHGVEKRILCFDSARCASFAQHEE